MQGRNPRPQDIHLAHTQAVLRRDPAGCRPHAHDVEESALIRPAGRDSLDASLHFTQRVRGVRTEACGGRGRAVTGGTPSREHVRGSGFDSVADGHTGSCPRFNQGWRGPLRRRAQGRRSRSQPRVIRERVERRVHRAHRHMSGQRQCRQRQHRGGQHREPSDRGDRAAQATTPNRRLSLMTSQRQCRATCTARTARRITLIQVCTVPHW